MSGFILGILATFFWSCVNIIDKYLINRHSSSIGVGGLLILSSLSPLIIAFFIGILNQNVFQSELRDTFILISSGIFSCGWIYFYLSALFDSDVSRVIPIFQITPIFVFLFAFVFLNEIPSSFQCLSAGIILIGAMILSYEKSLNKFHLTLFIKLISASILIAAMNVSFKFVAQDIGFWISIFWQSIGIGICGLLLLSFHIRFRKDFLNFVMLSKLRCISLNLLNEALTLVGDLIFSFALLLGTASIIQSTEAFQSIWVLIIGVIMMKINPKFKFEDLSSESFKWKMIGTGVVFSGSILLSFTKT